MKVFYKNKVGVSTDRYLFECSDCIFHPKNNNLYKCWHVGLMHLCCSGKCCKFVSSFNVSIFKL